MRSRKPSQRQQGTPHRKGAASFRFRVVVMAKEPMLGRVKTRLGREIGSAHATRFYRSTTAAVLARLSVDARFETSIGLSPDAAIGSQMRSLPPMLRRIGQGRGDLGARMLHLVRVAPPGPVVVIGSDIPGVTGSAVVAALRLLGRNDVVLGPAGDGGFWLVGFSRRQPLPHVIFDNVRWSSETTLKDVLANCRGFRVGLGPMLSDVDTRADLAMQSRMAGRRILPL